MDSLPPTNNNAFRSSIGKARTVSTEVKAAFLCGMYNGFKHSPDPEIQVFVEALRPHAATAAMVAFGDGAFNPISVWAMESFYHRVCDNCEQGGAAR